jgi:deazaflavin-dependent oxidoreductase (nitroreductase family)
MTREARDIPVRTDGGMEADLTDWGKAIELESTGRRSGEDRRVTIGFVAEPDGSLLVAAGSTSTGWARNLLAAAPCRVRLDGRWSPYRAERLVGQERGRAVVALIIKYGTPAERLGRGPAFRLRPVPASSPHPATADEDSR